MSGLINPPINGCASPCYLDDAWGDDAGNDIVDNGDGTSTWVPVFDEPFTTISLSVSYCCETHITLETPFGSARLTGGEIHTFDFNCQMKEISIVGEPNCLELLKITVTRG